MAITYKGQNDSYAPSANPWIANSPLAQIFHVTNGKGEDFCLKLFTYSNKEKSSRYVREVAARKYLNHPNILPILDYGVSEGTDGETPFIVMPLCRGGDLRQYLKSVDYLSPHLCIPIFTQIAAAIDYAHEKGIIHGDIKPSNILFTDEDRAHAVLSDFGIAKFNPAREDITEVPAEGGTIGYLSPEQIKENKQTPLSDIYSLAMVAYECLTGELPFDTKATTYQQMQTKIDGKLFDPQKIRPNLPKELCDYLMLGLHSDPSLRPITASKFVESLEAPAGNQATTKVTKNKSGNWWSSLSNNQRIAILTAIITTAGTIIVALISLLKK